MNDVNVLSSSVLDLMKVWEETSYRLECRQTNVECALQEYSELKDRSAPVYKLTFDPDLKSKLKEPLNRKIIFPSNNKIFCGL